MTTHIKLRISAAALRLVEGKIADRITGVTDNGNDVYQKMIDAGANEFGFLYVDAVYITASRADCAELAAEMDWALDGLRDISLGERNAARALRKRAAAFAA